MPMNFGWYLGLSASPRGPNWFIPHHLERAELLFILVSLRRCERLSVCVCDRRIYPMDGLLSLFYAANLGARDSRRGVCRLHQPTCDLNVRQYIGAIGKLKIAYVFAGGKFDWGCASIDTLVVPMGREWSSRDGPEGVLYCWNHSVRVKYHCDRVIIDNWRILARKMLRMCNRGICIIITTMWWL